MGVAPEDARDWNSRAQIDVLCFLQPFYRQQMEGAATFVRMEQERDQLRAALEQANSKYETLCSRSASTAFIANFVPLIRRREGEHEDAGRGAGEIAG